MGTNVGEATTTQADESGGFRYWAFISYSSTDKSMARWLHRAIENYGIPARLTRHRTPSGDPAPKHMRPVFRDRTELPAAADLSHEIETALSASRYLIVICSPHAARSKWVNTEIEMFRRLRGPEHVFAVIVDGKVDVHDERYCFPPALRHGTPVAADARPGGDGRRNVKLKLLAGMLGVGFDDLKQRDNRRRMRRMQAVVAGALAVTVVVASLAVYAERERGRAVQARQRAEHIMEFMLYDLETKLEPLGRLDVIQDVQAQVDAYYADLGVDSSYPNAQRNKAVAHHRKGDLLLARGDPAGALDEYRQATQIWEPLALTSPDDSLLLRSLALAHANMGRALQAQGDLAAAITEYRTSLDMRSKIAAADPTDVAVQYELSSSHNLLGTALWQRRDLRGTLIEFRASMGIKQSLAAADPADPDLRYAVALEHSNIGSVLDQLRMSTAAQDEYRAGLAIVDALVASDYANTRWQVMQAALHNNMGASLDAQAGYVRHSHRSAHLRSSLLHSALEHYGQAAAIMQRLHDSDPSNVSWQDDLLLYQSNVSFTRYELGLE
jgi:tetratricopeptide (TPR) repeat protein